MFTVLKGMVNVPSPLNWMPIIRAFGTGCPPKFWWPSKVQIYNPRSCPASQRPSGAACAVEWVLSVIAASRHTNAQAKDRKPIIIFVNFVFIVVFSFCLGVVVLAFFWLLILRSHFWPFTEVLGRIWRFVTRKKQKL